MRGAMQTRPPGERLAARRRRDRRAFTLHLSIVAALALGLIAAAALGRTAGVVPPASASGSSRSPSSLVAAKAVSAGNISSCALTHSGAVRCWGGNAYGAIGDGTTEDRRTPVDVLSGVKAIGVGGRHSCALTRGGGVKCWGLNDQGQLGEGAGDPVSEADRISGLAQRYSCDRRRPAAQLRAHERRRRQVLGLQTRTGSWATERQEQPDLTGDVSGLSSGVTAMQAGTFRSCALTSTGAVKCWGGFAVPRGDGPFIDYLTPVDVLGPERRCEGDHRQAARSPAPAASSAGTAPTSDAVECRD